MNRKIEIDPNEWIDSSSVMYLLFEARNLYGPPAFRALSGLLSGGKIIAIAVCDDSTAQGGSRARIVPSDKWDFSKVVDDYELDQLSISIQDLAGEQEDQCDIFFYIKHIMRDDFIKDQVDDLRRMGRLQEELYFLSNRVNEPMTIMVTQDEIDAINSAKSVRFQFLGGDDNIAIEKEALKKSVVIWLHNFVNLHDKERKMKRRGYVKLLVTKYLESTFGGINKAGNASSDTIMVYISIELQKLYGSRK